MLYLDEVRICFCLWVGSNGSGSSAPYFFILPPNDLSFFPKNGALWSAPPPFLLCLTGLHCRYYCDASPPTGRLNPFNLSNRFRLSWYFFNIDVSLKTCIVGCACFVTNVGSHVNIPYFCLFLFSLIYSFYSWFSTEKNRIYFFNYLPPSSSTLCNVTLLLFYLFLTKSTNITSTQ